MLSNQDASGVFGFSGHFGLCIIGTGGNAVAKFDEDKIKGKFGNW